MPQPGDDARALRVGIIPSGAREVSGAAAGDQAFGGNFAPCPPCRSP
jgi:hypothetical protein